MRSAIRKLIKVGKRSYAVVIPKKWIELLRLRSGDSLYIVLDDDGVLRVSPLRVLKDTARGPPTHLRIAVLPSEERALEKVLLALYSTGLPGVVVGGEVPSGSDLILSELMREMVRTKQTTSIGFIDLRADPPEVLETMAGEVERVFKILVDSLESPSADKWREIHEVEKRLDILSHAVMRLTLRRIIDMAMRRGVDSSTLLSSILNVVASKIVEGVSDCLDRSVYRVEELLTISRDYVALLSEAGGVYSEAFGCYLHGCSAEEVLLLLDKASKLRKRLKEVMAMSAPPLLPLLAELEVIVTLVEDLLETVLVKVYG